jgi:hypothetical protein
MLLIPEKHPVKNPYWQHLTPNEAFEKDRQYETIATAFAKKGEVVGPYKFFEVRIIGGSSMLSLEASSRWWDDPMFMERIFWVYQKPVYFYPSGQQHWGAYALEFYEAQRVVQAATKKFGYNPFDEHPNLLVPIDCVQLAWNETSNGISDHCRYRAKVEPTQAEIDREGRIQEEVKKITENLEDISDRPWGRDVA